MTEPQLRDPIFLTRPMSPENWFLRLMILENDRRAAWFRMRDRIDVLEATVLSQRTPSERTELSNLRRRMADEDALPWRLCDPHELEAWQREMAGRRTSLQGRAA